MAKETFSLTALDGGIAKETFSLDVNHCNVLRRFMFADFFRLFLAFIPIIMYLCIDLKLEKWQK